MKVLIVEPEASGHRMALYVRLLVRGCIARGWKVGLLTTQSAAAHAAFALVLRESADIHVSLVEDVAASHRAGPVWFLRNQLAYYDWMVKGFRKCASEQGADVVYVNGLDYLDKVLAVRGSPFGDSPFAGMMMDVKYHRRAMSIGPSARSDRLYEWLFRRVLRKPEFLSATVIDEAFVSYVAASGYAEYDKIRYVPDVGEVHGNEPRATSRAALGIAESAFVTLVYGSLTGRKGVRELIGALARREAPCQIVVLLAGIPDEDTRTLLGTSPAVELVQSRRLIISDSFHDDALEFRVFNAADAVWLGYVGGFLGSSGVLYQAGSMGLPVVASQTGLIGWINNKHEVGVSVDPLDSAATLSGLVRLAHDRGLASRLGANGQRLAAQHSGDQFADAVLDALIP